MDTHLFTVTTTRDEMIVGFHGVDSDAALVALTQAMTTEPATLLWRYVNTRGESGTVEQAPVTRVALFRDQIVSVVRSVGGNPIVPLPSP